MALAYPDLYAAVGIHSGLAGGSAGSMATAFSTMRRGALPALHRLAHEVPTIVFHGDNDRTVSHRQRRSGHGAGAAGRPVQDQHHHGAIGGRHGLHTDDPDGARRPLDLGTMGPPRRRSRLGGWQPCGLLHGPGGPDASREMLRFFQSHAMATV